MNAAASHSHHRIALISGGIPSGGSTIFLINLAGELVRRGIPVEVISFERENPLSVEFESQNIPVLCLDQRRMIFEDRLKMILRKLAYFQPTVVVSNLGATSFEVLRYLPKGVLRVGMGHTHDPLVYGMMRHYAPFMDLAAVVSGKMKQTVASMPEFAQVPVAGLLLGVPMPPAADLPAREFTRPLRVLYLGRLFQEQKRVRLFPEILRQMCASGMPFHWTIAGEGEERGFLESNMKTNSPDQTVSFSGAVSYSEIGATLKQHDIYLLASNYEGLPLSLLEAMGYGLVPVVSDLESGISEMVDDSIGIRVPVNDVSGYARAIIRLHENRREMAAKSAAARARVQQDFSVAAMADRWLAAFPPAKFVIEPWPKRWRIQPIINAGTPFHFSGPMRILRRVVARMRNWTIKRLS
jgi:hypothetical protein